MIDQPATNPIPPLGRGLGLGLARTVGAHWKWYVAEGVILIILGILAVLAPFRRRRRDHALHRLALSVRRRRRIHFHL